MKSVLKHKAIEERRKGKSYREILERVPVTKSTLSLWLRSVGLSRRQKIRLTEKRLAASKRGGEVRHKQRIFSTQETHRISIAEIGRISKRELMLIGATIYWGEGSKAKEYYPSAGTQITNSDPSLLRITVRWLVEICKVQDEDIKYEIYVHETETSRVPEIRKYWSRELRVPIVRLNKIYFKRNKVGTNRRNKGSLYYGLVRITIRRSTSLNRRISGWILGIADNWGVV
ncbi:MAG: hypothetical protein AAB597_02345 [Patescibacteria group bacterium]